MARDIARLGAAFNPALDRVKTNSGGGTAKGGNGPAGSRIALRSALCICAVAVGAIGLARPVARPTHPRPPPPRRGRPPRPPAGKNNPEPRGGAGGGTKRGGGRAPDGGAPPPPA